MTGIESRATTTVTFRLNGRTVRAEVAPDESLVQTLRGLGEYTARESCAVGLCGCCAVRVDGKAVSSCLYWSVLAEGREVSTLPGLSDDPRARILQDAVGECGAAQCGYCTPGMIVTALDLVGSDRPTEPQAINEWMSGNLCRCACYPELVEAISAAAQTRPPAMPEAPK